MYTIALASCFDYRGFIMEQAIHMIITSAIGYIIAHYIVKALDNIRKKK
nr:MAG TPA: Cytochrome c oxidase subunit 1 [Caudoviricetes sp.]DAS21218.1 MAG TPA: Cytochrome c oxidase subunit 1 [Caudoviricetes sp.]